MSLIDDLRNLGRVEVTVFGGTEDEPTRTFSGSIRDRALIDHQVNEHHRLTDERRIQAYVDRMLEQFGAGGLFFMTKLLEHEERMDKIDDQIRQLSDFCRELDRRQKEFENVVTQALNTIGNRLNDLDNSVEALETAGEILTDSIANLYRRIDQNFAVKIERTLAGGTSIGSGLSAMVGEKTVAYIQGGGRSAQDLARQVTKTLIQAPRTVRAWVHEEQRITR